MSRSPILKPLAAAVAAATLVLPVLANLPTPGLAEVQELAGAGRTGDAMRKLDALIAKSPDDPQLRFQKGVLLVDQKRVPEAIVLFERMGRDFPSLPEPLNNLAVLYAEQGQMEKARTALESAMRSRPSYNTAYENLASLNVRLASRAYARALQIDDSGGAPKLSLLKSLGGSAPGAVTVASAMGPTPVPGAPLIAAAPPPNPAASQATPSDLPSSASPRSPDAATAARLPAAPDNGAASRPVARDASADASLNGAKPKPGTQSKDKRSTDEAREIHAAVNGWAAAWERKDMNAYIGAYIPGFKGSDGTAARWQEGRRQRIVGKNRISIELTGVTVELTAEDTARVSFKQDYTADQLSVTGHKVLELVKRNGQWLIRKESVSS